MKYTKVYFDTEFTGLHKNTTLISIGLISEHGDTFYAESIDYDRTQVDDWIQKNVIRNLILDRTAQPSYTYKFENDRIINRFRICGTNEMIAHALSDWCERIIGVSPDKIEIWSDCLAYDWVLINDLFGHAFQLPKNIYYIPFDLCTLLKINGIDPDISREKFAEVHKKDIKKHNALWDAKVIRICVEKLLEKTNAQ